MKTANKLSETPRVPVPELPIDLATRGNGSIPPLPANGSEPATEAVEPSKSRFAAIELETGVARRESIFKNLDALRIPPDEDEDDSSEEVLSTVPVRRPGKRAFRTHPDDKYQFEAYILENQKEKVSNFVVPALGKALVERDAIESLKRVILVLCINKSGRMFWWPLPAKGTFRDSGLRAADLARTTWIKAVGDMEQGGYQIHKMLLSDYGEPAWPAVMPSVEELLELAFPADIIDSVDHPELKAAKNI